MSTVVYSPVWGGHLLSALFGSYAREEATEDSDLGFLAFGGDLFKKTLIFTLAEELREAFGKPVDVFEIHEVNQDRAFYDAIMRERKFVGCNGKVMPCNCTGSIYSYHPCIFLIKQ